MADVGQYLETAAAHLQQAAQNLIDAVPGLTWAEKFEARMRLAESYMRLAAIGQEQDAGSTP